MDTYIIEVKTTDHASTTIEVDTDISTEKDLIDTLMSARNSFTIKCKDGAHMAFPYSNVVYVKVVKVRAMV